MINAIKFWGGGEQWYWQVATGLRDRGHAVTIAGRRDGVFLERFDNSGIPTLPLRMQSDYGPGDVLTLRRWLKSHSPVAVICNLTRDVRLVGLAASGLPGVRIIWAMGSILIRNRWRDRSLVSRSVDRIVVPSESLAAELRGLGYILPSIISVVPIGLDLDLWGAIPPRHSTNGEDGGSPIAGVFGRLEARKGHRFLLDAWTGVCSRYPQAVLWIVGTGSEETVLHEQARALGLEDRIRFWGFQSDVRTILTKVDLVVQPSLYEPFGIILLEAMACGRPIVCTTAGGMPEVVDKACARLVPPGDPQALESEIIRVLGDRERSSAMGEAGRRRVEEQFGLPLMLDRVESVIAQVMR